MPYLFLRLEGLTVFLVTMILYFSYGGTYLGLLLLLLPDISLIGYLKNPKVGSIIYNIGHTYLSAIIFLGLSLWLGKFWGGLFALLWMAHIGLDRSLGLGLKFPNKFTDTHLGNLKNNPFATRRHN